MGKRKILSLAACFMLVSAALSAAQAQTVAADPVIGKSPRYCNPLPMVSGQGGSASGDVTVIKENDKYYMYCTGGGAWISEDMLTWTFQRVANVPVAPDVVKFNGSFYMCGNDGPLYKADNPLGPFTSLGSWKNTPDVAGGWNGAFDMHIFIDDDNKPYLYYPGRGVAGIYVVPLDPDDLTRFADKPTHLFSFNSSHIWERYGDWNEYPDVAWVEGPWLEKYNGTYYLQYSASGTQWKTYAEGYYTAKSPLGPFTYAPNNPLLRKTEGVVTGPAHGCIVEGPDKNLWQFYTIVLSNPPGGRRVGMDRVVFDKDGNMSVKVTETPQWAPGAVTDPARGDSDSIPVTINKIRAMNALSRYSSQQTGRDAAYAIDNSTGTWWEPAADDNQPALTIELSPATRFDVVQLFTIDSLRLMFGGSGGFGRGGFGRGGAGGRGLGRGGPGAAAPGAGAAPAAPAAPAATSALPATNAYQYKIEVSTDGNAYTTALDMTKNDITRNTIFEEIPPVKCRFVRLTMTNWPRTSSLGIIEFTVFGKPAGSLPAAVPIPQ
ncbi:MAG: family 43 glycosylhydrolase [Sedimentisphaerales bacterium]|nr:family 43 glycosylhydrolase [Sedimentisphaerales bacterium]